MILGKFAAHRGTNHVAVASVQLATVLSESAKTQRNVARKQASKKTICKNRPEISFASGLFSRLNIITDILFTSRGLLMNEK